MPDKVPTKKKSTPAPVKQKSALDVLLDFKPTRAVSESTSIPIKTPLYIQPTATQLRKKGFTGKTDKDVLNQKHVIDSVSNVVKNINSTKADIVRTITPAPKNAAQMIAKMTGDARMTNSSLTDQQKLAMWNVIKNAKKRTGKLNGGTEYADYAGENGTAEEFNNWFNKGKNSVGTILSKSGDNPGYTMASTVGRGRYYTDPSTGKTFYTDVYDWNASKEKNFAGTNAYQNIRNSFRNGEDKNLTKEKNDKFRMGFSFNEKEMEELQKKVTIKKESGIRNAGEMFFHRFFKNGGLVMNDNDPNSITAGKVTNDARRDLQSRRVSNPYGKYTGDIMPYRKRQRIDLSNPTELEAILTNISYMKNNYWDGGSTMPYRPENMHIAENGAYEARANVPIASNGMGMPSVFDTIGGEGTGGADLAGVKGKGTDGATKGAGVASAVGNYGNYAASIIDSFDTGESKGYRSVGGATASGALKGAAVGAAAGPWGALIGAGVGAITGYATSTIQKKKVQSKQEDNANRARDHYGNFAAQTNFDEYGNQFEDGGMVDQKQLPAPQKPPMRLINVEKNELMVDPVTGEVVQKFNNPHRFKSHQDKQLMEPIGNFVEVPSDKIIIPKKFASRYERGDKLTRSSIMRQLLSDQVNDPMHNVPDEMQSTTTEQYSNGGSTNGNPPRIKGLTAPLITPAPEYDPFYYQPEGRERIMQTITPEGYQPMLGAIEDIPVDEVAGEKKNNFGKFGRAAMESLPIIAQMFNNAKSDQYLAMNTNDGYDAAMSQAGQLPEDISIAGNLFANDNSFAGASRAINNNDTPSVRAEAGELYSRKLAADNAVYSGRESSRAQMRAQKLQALMGLEVSKGADYEAAANQYMNEQRMDQAARENNTMAGMVNMTTNVQKRSNDLTMVDAYNEMSHFFDIDPYGKQMLKEDPSVVKFILDFIQDNPGTQMEDALKVYESKKKTTTSTTTKSGNTKQTKTQTTGK